MSGDSQDTMSAVQEAARLLDAAINDDEHQRTPDRDTLDEAIRLFEQAYDLTQGDALATQLAADITRQLALAYECRFRNFHAKEDLRIAVSLSEDALRSAGGDDPDGPEHLPFLLCTARCSRTRYITFGKGRDLQRAVSLAQRIMAHCPSGHPRRLDALENLIGILYAHFDKDPKVENLDVILGLQRPIAESYSLRGGYGSGEDRTRKWSRAVGDLSDTLMNRFDLTTSREDIDRAISLKEECLALLFSICSSPPDAEDEYQLMSRTKDYCAALSIRRRQFSLSDFDLSVSAREDILERFPPGHPSRLHHLRKLTSIAHVRADTLWTVPSHVYLFPLYEEMREISPKRTEAYVKCLTEYASAIDSVLVLGDISAEAIDTLVSLREEVISILPQDDPDYVRALGQLVDALDWRYDLAPTHADRDKVIDLYKSILSLHPASDLERATYLIDAGHALKSRFLKQRQQPDLLSALSYFEELDTGGYNLSSSSRISTIVGYVSCMLLRFQEIKISTVSECDHLIELTSEAISLVESSPADTADGPTGTATTTPTTKRTEQPIAHVYLLSAQILQHKFTMSWDDTFLDRAIPEYRTAVSLFEGESENKLGTILRLAEALKVRHLIRKEDKFLDESIEVYEGTMIEVGVEDKWEEGENDWKVKLICGLSDALRLRFKKHQKEEDVTRAVQLSETALSLSLETKAATEEYTESSILAQGSLANAFHARSVLPKHRLADLGSCIQHYNTLLRLLPPTHRNYQYTMRGLTSALRERFRTTGDLSDIDFAIQMQKGALYREECGYDHPAYLGFANEIVQLLLARNTTRGDPGDLEEAMAYCREAFEACILPSNSSSSSAASSSPGSRKGGSVKGADRMSQLLIMSNYMSLLQARYGQTVDPRDWDQIQLVRDTILNFEISGKTSFSVDLLKKNAAFFHGPAPHGVSGGSGVGGWADLEEMLSEESKEMYNSVEDKARFLMLLAKVQDSRYEESGDKSALDKAESYYRQALEILPPIDDDADEGHQVLASLASIYEQKFFNENPESVNKRGRDIKFGHLDTAIKFSEEALAVAIPGTRRHAMRKERLGALMSVRYRRFNRDPPFNKEEMETAVKMLRVAAGHLRDAANATECGLQTRYLAAHQWATTASGLSYNLLIIALSASLAAKGDTSYDAVSSMITPERLNSEVESTLEAFHSALATLPQLAHLGTDVRASLHAIQQTKGLPSDAAIFILQLPMLFDDICQPERRKTRDSRAEEAIEVLEEGRSVIWTQATRLRTPLDQVERVVPELAKKLKDLSNILEGHSPRAQLSQPTQPLPLDGPRIPAETSAPRHGSPPSMWHIRQEWLSVVEQIRLIPGFQYFLSRKPYEHIAEVAREGPVVILVAHEWISFALVLREEEGQGSGAGGKKKVECKYVELKTNVGKLVELSKRLRKAVEGRGGWTTQEVEEDTATRDGGEKGQLRAGRPKKKVVVAKPEESGTDVVLSQLWTDVGEPIVNHLTGLIKPTLGARKRIWWCPVGQFVFMPIHASRSKHHALSDFFISSYTPTLDALLQARSRPIPSQDKTRILAAIQPNAGKGWSALPNTKAELEEVYKIVPRKYLISLEPDSNNLDSGKAQGLGATTENEENLRSSSGIDLEGTHTTPTNVVSHLPRTSILHLACHGTQNSTNPLRSGFILRNTERLTVEMLMKATADGEGEESGKCIAILSACHTAGGDDERPDEAINLASAMLFVGFRSVLATMWPMGDPDGPTLTRAIYTALFDPSVNGDLNKFCLATIIDGIARDMREMGILSERWATFIHSGA